MVSLSPQMIASSPHHHPSSPRRRGSSTPGTPCLNRWAAAYWVARSSRAMTAEFVAGARNQPRRPGERRDPYRVISLVGAVAETFRHHARRWLWVPAFAGTTRGETVPGHNFSSRHHPSSPRRRGSSTPGTPCLNRWAAAYWVARSSRAMTAECVAGARNQPRRPGERRDPYRVISLVGAVAETFRHHARRWLW